MDSVWRLRENRTWDTYRARSMHLLRRRGGRYCNSGVPSRTCSSRTWKYLRLTWRTSQHKHRRILLRMWNRTHCGEEFPFRCREIGRSGCTNLEHFPCKRQGSREAKPFARHGSLIQTQAAISCNSLIHGNLHIHVICAQALHSLGLCVDL